jgi:CHAT domain-containing protein
MPRCWQAGRAGRGGLAVRLLGLVLAWQASVTLGQPVPVEEPPTPEQRALQLNQRGVQLHHQGRLAEARQLLEEALTINRGLQPAARYPAGHPNLVTGLNNLGRVREDQGDYAGAAACFREALAMCRKLYPPASHPDGHPALVLSLSNLASALQLLQDHGQAEALADEALALGRKVYPAARFPAGHPVLANCLFLCGRGLKLRGELARAEPYYRQSLAIYQRLYPPERYPAGHTEVVTGLQNLGTLLVVRGQLAQAEPVLRDAVAMYRRLYPKDRYPSGHPSLALTISSLGLLLAKRGKTAEAEAVFGEGLAMSRQLYPPERYPAGHPTVAAGLNHLGMCLELQGRYGPAEALLREALAMNQRLYPAASYPEGHPHLVHTLDNLSYLFCQQGEPARAEPFSRQAQAMQVRLLGAFLAGASEAEALNHLARLPPTCDAYLSVLCGRPGSDGAAHAAVWQSRGVLAQWLGLRRLAARAAADPKARDLARRLAQTRRELAARLLAPAGVTGAQAKGVRALADEKEQLEKALAQCLPAFARQLQSSHTTPEDLCRWLPDGVVYIDLVRYLHFELDAKQVGLKGARKTPCYAAFVLCKDRPSRRVELGRAEPIDQAVRAWRAALTKNPKSEIQKPKAQRPEMVLRRVVWEPLARQLPAGTRTIYLAPDGALRQLPWAALPGERPATVLLEDYALAVVPHGQLLLEALSRAKPDGVADGSLLAVGGVAYDQAPATPARAAAVARAAGVNGKVSWPALPGAERELERVLTLAGKRPTRVRRGTEACTAQILADLPQVRWAHLATHGFFADASFRSALHLAENDYQRDPHGERIGAGARSPLVLSGLVLAGANRQGKDAPADGGILTAEAIAGLDLDGLELAVLSACDTGLGEVAGGEGVFGLQRAFHLAGARNVVASLWQVDDEATAALMGLFYHHLCALKQPPLEALRQAQLALYHHPERIGPLARARGPDFDKAARLPATPQAADRAPARLWAGFVLSGLGR